VMTAVQEGLLSLDDPVAKHIPCFQNFMVYCEGSSQDSLKTQAMDRPMLVRHLLTHTWGFPGLPIFQSLDAGVAFCDRLASCSNPTPNPTSDASFEDLVKVPLLHQPGSCFRFGIGPHVAAHIVCKLSGKSLQDLISERVLSPLQMDSTGWTVPVSKQSRVLAPSQAVPRYVGNLGLRWTGRRQGHTSKLGWKAQPIDDFSGAPVELNEPSPASPLWSTSGDFMKVQLMLQRGGLMADGSALLTQESMLELTSDKLQGSLANPAFNTHAKDVAVSAGLHPSFGVGAPGQGVSGTAGATVVDPSTSRLAGTAGSYSGVGCDMTEYWNDPLQELSVFVGAQLFPFYALPELRQELSAIVYASMLPPAAVKFYQGPEPAQQGGMMMNLMNAMMMMSMFAPASRM